MRPAIIGAQTSIEGSVVGAEELIIDGQVTGTVEYKCNRVSIGNTGRVKGDIYAQTLHVAGSVKGRLMSRKRSPYIARRISWVRSSRPAWRWRMEQPSRATLTWIARTRYCARRLMR
ncbi:MULTISPECIES: bactofilin family protein [Halomonadaceae]|nr:MULTISPECIES: polymer-forming cytoskeletal protein [Halomonas]MCD6009945.1 polymer-forming cytoskeletal protein [Halomonas sp. IOP_31]